MRSRSVFLTTYRAKASFATMGVTDSLKKLYESEMTGANRESTMNLIRAAGLFAGAIVVMRCFGDAFAI